MTQIKRRPRWVTFTKPRGPSAPWKPQEEWVSQKFIEFAVADGDQTRLGDLVLPEGVQLCDVVVEGDGYQEGNCVRFGTLKEVRGTYPDFKSQMKKYEKARAKWDAECAAYAEEVKEWELWVEQEKRRTLNMQLKQARNLLRKHGKLK
jgi:hypothetical protein